MQFQIARDALLKPLQLVSGVVERRSTLPVLSNLLLELQGDRLSLTSSNQELELSAEVSVSDTQVEGRITASARKLSDICRSLPDESVIRFTVADAQMRVSSGRSNFTLATLPAEDFPKSENEIDTIALTLTQEQLAELLASTSFAMAQKDFRPYLNGMLIEVDSASLRAVATDGHRLALHTIKAESNTEGKQRLILPRKSALELARLLQDPEEPVTITGGASHFRATMNSCTLVSKLVNSRYADYERVIPRNGSKTLVGNCQALRQACQRASILFSEKYQIASFDLGSGEFKVVARNPDQEVAEESVSVDYEGDPIQIGFNVSYLIHVFTAIKTDKVRIELTDANSAVLLEPVGSPRSAEGPESAVNYGASFVVSPSRL